MHDLQPLAARIAPAEGIIPVAANLDDAVFLDSNLKPAEIRSQYTGRLFPIHYFNLLIRIKRELKRSLAKTQIKLTVY